jgi:hypothetical protein
MRFSLDQIVRACKNVIKEASRRDPVDALLKKLGLKEASNEDIDD